MSQPAVSQQVKALETHLGQTLFLRQGRRLEITVAGKSYLPTVQDALETLSQGTRELIGGDRGRRLNVQCNLAFSIYWLSPRLGDLLTRFPWLNINVQGALWDPERTAETADVEVRFGTGLDRTLGGLRLAEDTSFPVCAPELVGQDWRKHNLFDCAGMKGNWQSWSKKVGQRMPANKRVNIGSTYAVSLSAAVEGCGFAMGHETLVDGLLSKGRLCRAHPEGIEMPEAYFLMPVLPRSQTPATRSFAEWLREEAGA